MLFYIKRITTLGKEFFHVSIHIIATTQFCFRQVFSKSRTTGVQVIRRQYRLSDLYRLEYYRSGKIDNDICPVHQMDGMKTAACYPHVGQVPERNIFCQGLLSAAAGMRLYYKFHPRKACHYAHYLSHFFPESGKITLSQKHRHLEVATGSRQG